MSILSDGMGSIKKNPISIGCAILAIALIGIAYVRFDDAAESQTELDLKSAEAAKLALNVKYGAQLKEHLDALIAAQKTIESRMIRAGDLPANSNYFYKLESDSGVKLLDGSLRQSPGSKKDPKATYQPTVFNLSVEGDYRQLLTFLRRLESGPRYCRILTATCNAPAERSKLLVLSLSLELLGFQ